MYFQWQLACLLCTRPRVGLLALKETKRSKTNLFVKALDRTVGFRICSHQNCTLPHSTPCVCLVHNCSCPTAHGVEGTDGVWDLRLGFAFSFLHTQLPLCLQGRPGQVSWCCVKILRAFLHSIALIQHFTSQFSSVQLPTHKSTGAFGKAEKPYGSLLIKGQGETIRTSMLIYFWTEVLKITTTIYSVKMPGKHFRIRPHRRSGQINALIVYTRKQLEKVKQPVSKVKSHDVTEPASEAAWPALEPRLCP